MSSFYYLNQYLIVNGKPTNLLSQVILRHRESLKCSVKFPTSTFYPSNDEFSHEIKCKGHPEEFKIPYRDSKDTVSIEEAGIKELLAYYVSSPKEGRRREQESVIIKLSKIIPRQPPTPEAHFYKGSCISQTVH